MAYNHSPLGKHHELPFGKNLPRLCHSCCMSSVLIDRGAPARELLKQMQHTAAYLSCRAALTCASPDLTSATMTNTLLTATHGIESPQQSLTELLKCQGIKSVSV
jgi:hypothetical protein